MDDGMQLSPLITTGWLAEHIEARDMVVLDCTYFMPALQRDANAEFRARRIPGALRFDIDEIKAASTDLPHMLPSPEDFARAMEALGITSNSTVIAYDALGIMSAPRVWWTFRVFGHLRVAVLDGGLPKWEREGRQVESGPVRPAQPSKFTAGFRPELVSSREDVLALSSGSRLGQAQIVDARSRGRWLGVDAEPRAGLAQGHIPSSLNLPFGSLLTTDGVFDTPEGIAISFAKSGVRTDRPIVATCGSGITACVVALGATLAGFDNISVYDGSWAEWGSDPTLPVATGSA